MERTRVVVSGIGLVTPLGCSPAELWPALCAGRSGVAPIRAFDASPYPSRIAAEVAGFDAARWLRPRTRRRSGRVAQFALAAATMALEDAGLVAAAADAATAVILGSGYGSMPSVEEAYRVFFAGDWRKNPIASVPLCMPNAPASQVALEFGLQGPCYVLSAACASGAAAIAEATRLIRQGVVRRALAGGVDATVLPGVFSIWCLLGVLSRRNHDPAGACAPFSADRDGLVMGEGACLLLLEARDQALERGVEPYAEIAGVGANCAADSVTAPSLEGEAEAMLLALADAGLAREEVGYVNAHGTATALNDAVETEAIKRVFGAHARALAVSSTKSMLGHTMGASSAIECAVTALALRHGLVPPTINLRLPDPSCDLDYVPWKARPAALQAALSNSFGFGGSNVILALRRAG